jgi:hypothetical protein
MVLLVYSFILLLKIHGYCEENSCADFGRFLGIWIVTNRNLFTKLNEKTDYNATMTQLLTLRSITFVILIFGNFMALYIAGRFKRRYPQPKNISNFSLIFKNIRIPISEFTETKLGKAEVKEIFYVKKLEPFYTAYKCKLETYYGCLIEEKENRKNKMVKKLRTYDELCSKT